MLLRAGYANVDTTLNVYAQMIDGVVRAAVDKLGSKTALEYSGSDGRHTAIAALAEKGRPDRVQIGHVAPEI